MSTGNKAKMHDAVVKQLRTDARRLETVAKHLRQQARDLAVEKKTNERAEKLMSNFYSKQSKVDPTLALIPDAPGIGIGIDIDNNADMDD